VSTNLNIPIPPTAAAIAAGGVEMAGEVEHEEVPESDYGLGPIVLGLTLGLACKQLARLLRLPFSVLVSPRV
jgi:hypothetical protein